MSIVRVDCNNIQEWTGFALLLFPDRTMLNVSTKAAGLLRKKV